MHPVKAVALDAMGVIYPVADDLRHLLIPYLRRAGSSVPDQEIIEAYRACYREGAPARSIWERAGFNPADDALEDGFIACYALNTGVIDFLAAMRDASIPVYGLSNDVGEWAAKRRLALGIDAFFSSWVISSEVRTTKPQPAIYGHLLDLLPCEPEACLFVDDRAENLLPASDFGLQTALFSADPADGLTSVDGFRALTSLVAGPAR